MVPSSQKVLHRCSKYHTAEKKWKILWQELLPKASTAAQSQLNKEAARTHSKHSFLSVRTAHLTTEHTHLEDVLQEAKHALSVDARTNHFVGSRNCSKSQISAVEAKDDVYLYDDSIGCISVGMLQTSRTNMVDIHINGVKKRMMVDSGYQPSLLPAHLLQEAHGRLQTSTVRLRPYGTTELLKVIGEIEVTLCNQNGGKHRTKVYVVDGHLTEPLLGESDARALGILTIHSRGTVQNSQKRQAVEVAGIVDGLRESGVNVKTRKEEADGLTQDEKEQVKTLVAKHNEVFEGIGLLKDIEVTLSGDADVEPVAAPYRPVPLAYQAKLSEHLQELREADKIENIGPEEECTWISNVVITEKKGTGKIRMSIQGQKMRTIN